MEIVGRVFAVNVGLVVLAVGSVMVRSVAADIVAVMLGAGLVAWLMMSFARGKR